MTTPPTAPTYADQSPPAPNAEPRCTRVMYCVLAFFLGVFGVHNFVAGHKQKAFIQLGLGAGGFVLTLTFIGAILGIPMMLIAGIWALVDIFTVTADGEGLAFDGSGVVAVPPVVTSSSPIPNVPANGTSDSQPAGTTSNSTAPGKAA